MSKDSENSSNLSQQAEFSVRIVVCDSYLCKPTPGVDVIYSDFRGSDIKQVPILRIFGAAPDGHKACLHVHGVFPYFYLPCPTSNPEPQFLYQIAASLDKALNIALKQATSSNQHVYKISLVKGLPLYGFHDKEHLFLKIFFYNPGLIKQAVELCSNGAIMGQVFQPHEAHINFNLQFFIDFNLFGMSNILLQSVIYRKNGSSLNNKISLESLDTGLKPESTCHYEVDCLASHIINRQKVGRGDGIENPGLEEVWNQEIERRKQLNVSMSKSLSQEQLNNSDETDSHYRFQQMFMNKLNNWLEQPAEVQTANDNDNVNYPAESMEGSQLFNAMDVSMHLPDGTTVNSYSDSLRHNFDDTLIDHDDTLVDENIALNSSLSFHYSQVQMDKDDLELVELLHDMEEETMEDDSIVMSAHEKDQDVEVDNDDDEYSQVFNEDTLLLEPCQDETPSSLSWNDSFWDSANITQLDGPCGDDYVKKVRKRKMRSFKLGLSKPKKSTADRKQDPECNLDLSALNEINVSQETLEDLSELYLKKSVNRLPDHECDKEITNTNVENRQSITSLVYNHEKLSQSNAKLYDKLHNFEPVAGPSHIIGNTKLIDKKNKRVMDTSQSSPEDIGITSFYDTSKMFNVSIDGNISDILSKTFCEDKEREFVGISRSSSDLNQHDTGKCVILTPMIRPPTKADVLNTLEKYEIPEVRNPEPYYSDPKDVGDKVEIGQIILKLHSKCAQDQKPYGKVLDIMSIEEWRQLLFLENNDLTDNSSKPETLKVLLAGNRQCILEPVVKPPTRKEVIKWSETPTTEEENKVIPEEISKNIDELEISQAIGLNEEINNSINLDANEMKNTLQVSMQGDGSYLCFGNNESTTYNPHDQPAVEVDFMTLMLIEVHASTRGDLHPNPKYDPILAAFITITNDCPPNHSLMKSYTEIIAADTSQSPRYLDRCILKSNVRYVKTESEILDSVIESVRKHDPDILCGYEIEMSSWGYVLERAQILGLEIVKEISRITEKHRQKRSKGDDNGFEGKIIGRITFNVWRLFRHELALSSYSFENCMYEILKERVPKFSYAELTKWWNEESRALRWLPVEYYLTRLSGTVRMLEKLDIVRRTSELARVFGLQWWEVWARGSQLRVESLLLRAARPLNLLPLSPSVRQRAAMTAPECLPLIFEPESRFYSDPVIVLDFQSLYPSMMIAYNYCFSTCIGRLRNINCDSNYEFGAWRLRIPRAKLERLVRNELVHWSPVGVGFVKSSVRRGVLPALLRRILAARLAVKKGMKLQTDPTLRKAMHSKQLGLKLIANVTYGYTAANFSGRMPSVEVADSVVSKGRETLQRAVSLVQRHPTWRAKVIYGDTDSLFVLVPGRSRAAAFDIGAQIAAAVTADNPNPVTLKLEKVYQPCILQTKKRYVGFMYESPQQEVAVVEAKGIETVRRDGCPAGVKLLHQSLCELFSSGDMSRVKRLVHAALERVCGGGGGGGPGGGGGGPADLVMTGEYRGAAGYRPGATAPPNEIAKRIRRSDERAAPRVGERVSWVVTAGAPGAALASLARPPADLLRRPRAPLVPLAAYYVTRVLLPPLHRCLSLLGVDVFKWWSELGQNRESGERRAAGGGIARFLGRARCAGCGARGGAGRGRGGAGRGRGALCGACVRAPRAPALRLSARARAADASLLRCNAICESCCGHREFEMCENAECPVIWRRLTAQRNLTQLKDVIVDLPSQFDYRNLEF